MRPPGGVRCVRLDSDLLRRASAPAAAGETALVVCAGAQWVDTRYGRRLLLLVAAGPVSGLWSSATLWTSRGSAAIIARRFGSDDPASWPDSFVLPLMIARNVKNPKTGERRDRVWVLPADLWPEADESGGGATAGAGT